MWKKLKPYLISIFVALAVGGLSAIITSGNMDLYRDIVKPPLSPPSVAFPIVWGILYVLMGISAAMIYTSTNAGKEDIASALKTYAVQLGINFFWSILFFNFRAFLLSYLWLVLLLVFICIMTIKFRKIRKSAAYLQVPYLLWVFFAGYLNLMIWILN